MAIVLHPDGTRSVITIAKGKKLSLDEMQSAVGGDIQLIPFKWRKLPRAALPVKDGKLPSSAWCDEEGKLKLKVSNPSANALFDVGYDHLVGDVLLTYPGEA